MDNLFNELQLAWIKDVLDQHGEFLHDLLQEAVESKRLIHSGELEQSLSYKVSMYGPNPALNISFLGYGRAIEIRFHKSTNSRELSALKTNRAILASHGAKPMRKKDTRWYARNVYGSLNRLIGILMYEFTDKERQRIKGILQQQKLRNL
ncbi:MAG: hypothetical protein NTU44_13460 [Bacteroidetes bacterium]|nr:hypothetical protein [Bacteroidota bacterium]